MERVAAIPDTVRVLIGAAGSALVIASIGLASFLGASTSFYSGLQPTAAAMALAGSGLLGSGLLMLGARPWWTEGPLMVAAAVLWFSPTWVAWMGGPASIRTVGMVAVVILPVVLAHVVLGDPDGAVRGRINRTVLALAYAVVTGEGAIIALFYDPFRDVGCWANCTDNVLLLAPMPRLAAAGMLMGACAMAALFWFVFARTVSGWARDRERGPRLAVIGASGALAAGATIDALVALGEGEQGPLAPWPTAARLMAATGAVLIALAPAWRLALARRRRRAIEEVVRSAGPGRQGAIEQSLRAAVGDPGLTIAYWLPASRRFVDSSGREIPEPDGTQESRAMLSRSGHPVAVIGHRIAEAELQRELGPAIRMAIENEGLRAEVDAQLAELHTARARIVADGDARRRDLERALHDGAQQQLTMLALRLQTLVDGARSVEEQCATALRPGVGLAREALEELRRIAHGIHPTALEHGGLPAALADFAVTARIPVELAGISQQRCSSAVEVTAYEFVVEAVEDAHRRGASHAVVRVESNEGALRVRVEDDGPVRPSTAQRIADRVGAVGGAAWTSAGYTRAELPCAS